MSTEGQILDEEVLIYQEFQKNPFSFIEAMRGLKPQKKEQEFEKGKHITWQQAEIVQAVREGITGEGSNKISIASGHGIGKSSILSMMILRFLFCYKDAQIPCTAPTQSQIYDVLWKELAVWLKRMPKEISELYDRQADYIRIKESPETWFARARTGKKENTEALAGVHSDYVMLLADEASGVADEIFEASKGALTNPTVLLILISNPTRLEGYFYRTHHELRNQFKCLQFNSEESPIVDKQFVSDIINEHGQDSDQYRIRVQGLFPKEGGVDDKGYIPLLNPEDLDFTIHNTLRPIKLGIDPAGEGSDQTVFVGRDAFVAKVLARELVSSEKSIAERAVTYAHEYKLPGEFIIVDNFGVGANVPAEMAYAGTKPIGMNVGNKADNDSMFENKRAEAYRRLRERLKRGGQLIGKKEDRKDLLLIKYKRGLNNKIKIMPKEDIRKEYGRSPDVADALMMTFCTIDKPINEKIKEKRPRTYQDPLTGEMKVRGGGGINDFKSW